MVRVKIRKEKTCTVCFNEIASDEKSTSYGSRGVVYYFHEPCYQSLQNKRKQIPTHKIMFAVMEFARRGFKPTTDRITGKKAPQAHVPSFEPPLDKKLDDLRMIIECLQHYKKTMSRKQIAEETNILHNTVTWRVWENMEGNCEKPIFFTDEINKGFRGTRLIGLVDFS